jgi:hypothetical protein
MHIHIYLVKIHLEFNNFIQTVTECYSALVSTPASYSEGTRFDTQPRDWLLRGFHDFPQSPKTNAGTVHWLFPFILFNSSFRIILPLGTVKPMSKHHKIKHESINHISIVKTHLLNVRLNILLMLQGGHNNDSYRLVHSCSTVHNANLLE